MLFDPHSFDLDVISSGVLADICHAATIASRTRSLLSILTFTVLLFGELLQCYHSQPSSFTSLAV